MKSASQNPNDAAFTCIELAIVIAVLGLLTLVLLPALAQDREVSHRKQCVNNLKQIGLAFKVWAVDNGDKYPMAVSTRLGGTKELAKGGNAFRHFQVMSNELSAEKLLICPDDTRSAAADFSDLQNKNLSYFVGLDATDSKPAMFLAGDRNIENGNAPVRSVLELRPEIPAHWTEQMHTNQGNVGLADGSVQQISTSRLQNFLKTTGNPINRVALPE